MCQTTEGISMISHTHHTYAFSMISQFHEFLADLVHCIALLYGNITERKTDVLGFRERVEQ